MILMSTMALCGCMEQYEPTPHVHFSIAASADGPTVIIVPMPVLPRLQNRLHVSEGHGTFEFVHHEHGFGIRVEFSESVNIEADWSEIDSEDFPRMTINLTTMIPLEGNESVWDPRGHGNGIPDREIMINWTSGPLRSMFIICRMQYDDLLVNRYHGSYDSLHVGWNQELIEGSQGNEYVD
jgi:hypothetical protein